MQRFSLLLFSPEMGLVVTSVTSYNRVPIEREEKRWKKREKESVLRA
jgi:hypothetical protein